VPDPTLQYARFPIAGGTFCPLKKADSGVRHRLEARAILFNRLLNSIPRKSNAASETSMAKPVTCTRVAQPERHSPTTPVGLIFNGEKRHGQTWLRLFVQSDNIEHSVSAALEPLLPGRHLLERDVFPKPDTVLAGSFFDGLEASGVVMGKAKIGVSETAFQ